MSHRNVSNKNPHEIPANSPKKKFSHFFQIQELFGVTSWEIQNLNESFNGKYTDANPEELSSKILAQIQRFDS